jgi:hypothetical protein
VGEREDLDRYRVNFQGEIDGAALYEALAELETQPELAEPTDGSRRPRSGTRRCGRRSCASGARPCRGGPPAGGHAC